ncbi:hypothetical protein MBRA_03805 [Methylobacterium brachiatum]|nr:hypothetical protein MBRA_03805 [Methylobacterium brachiatum]
MSLKYVFDVDAHTTQCMFTYDQNVGRLLEVFCYSRFLNEGPGWRYLGNSAGMVIALIKPDLSRNKAAQQLRQLHDEVCDNGIREHEFEREGWYEWTKSTPGHELGQQRLGFVKTTFPVLWPCL